MPTRARNVSGVAVRLPQRGEVWLFDCGEATQHQLQRTPLKISQISRIFITHLHGDHLFGLMGLLATCGLAGQGQEIHLYGPDGLADYVRLRRTPTRALRQPSPHTVEPGLSTVTTSSASLPAAQTSHHVYGSLLTESDRAGRFDVERARALGIHQSALRSPQRGESGNSRTGASYTVGVDGAPARSLNRLLHDTMYCRSAVTPRARGCFDPRSDLRRRRLTARRQSMHSTATVAARVQASAVRQLLLTHFSPRYTHEAPSP